MDRHLLIDSKTQFVGSLVDTLEPFVLHHLTALYLAVTKQHRDAPTLAFQQALRQVPHWNATAIAARTEEIKARCPWLTDLIAACFVTLVKILSSVKLHPEKPNINLKLPSNELFVHRVYVNVAREFYTNPSLVTATHAVKKGVVQAAVELSLRAMLPMEDILKAYLGNTYDGEENAVNPGEMTADDDFGNAGGADAAGPDAAGAEGAYGTDEPGAEPGAADPWAAGEATGEATGDQLWASMPGSQPAAQPAFGADPAQAQPLAFGAQTFGVQAQPQVVLAQPQAQPAQVQTLAPGFAQAVAQPSAQQAAQQAAVAPLFGAPQAVPARPAATGQAAAGQAGQLFPDAEDDF